MKTINHSPAFTAFLCLIIFTITGCASGDIEFTITNDSEFNRSDEPVLLNRQSVAEKGDIDDEKVPLVYLNGEAIPTQADDINLDGVWDELAFILNLDAEESATVTVRFVDENDYPEFTQRTNVRFGVKEDSGVNALEELTMTADELPAPPFSRFQMDGPAWENDKVGFRQYIDGRNGRDLYGKTTSDMALDTVGISDDGQLEDNYHVMLPWGRDILAVGNSLGLGGLAIMENGEAKRLGVRIDASRNNVDTTTYQLISEGPVRSVFRLTYKGWDTGERKIDLTNDVIIWAGQYSHINQVSISNSDAQDTLVVGLVNIHNDNPPTILEQNDLSHTAFFTHDQQTYDKEWYLGMGLVFPSSKFIDFQEAPESGSGITNSYLTLFDFSDDKTLEYHVFAGWELSDENFADEEYFTEFMTVEQQKISNPLQVE